MAAIGEAIISSKASVAETWCRVAFALSPGKASTLREVNRVLVEWRSCLWKTNHIAVPGGARFLLVVESTWEPSDLLAEITGADGFWLEGERATHSSIAVEILKALKMDRRQPDDTTDAAELVPRKRKRCMELSRNCFGFREVRLRCGCCMVCHQCYTILVACPWCSQIVEGQPDSLSSQSTGATQLSEPRSQSMLAEAAHSPARGRQLQERISTPTTATEPQSSQE
eukprot:gnl/TRDRNA2_/TRDRNA2_169203_c5_seq1.p1 gnl/TRDRNA2_/TRDRNA2_169203_c5~~gnl/TRDRNA2_/TRDRNA2_169203_c5_seq1.p1  ORF type:complete len:227 (-),score=22.21 gnl/TRDRNA2_/TRDRNA2_169203_c5_seq1:158-838(-)